MTKLPCSACGRETPIDQLDAKPSHLAGVPATAGEIGEAMALGLDFTVLEGPCCYGPAWAPMSDGGL